MKHLLLGILLAIPTLSIASDKKNEAFFCDLVASQTPGGAQTEVRTQYNKRVDLLTKTTANECDWSHKWAEAIGQSLTYAELTNRNPGIIIFHDVSKKHHQNNINVLWHMAEVYDITLRFYYVDRISGGIEVGGYYIPGKASKKPEGN